VVPADLSRWDRLFVELNELAKTHPNARRFSRNMISLGHTLNALSTRFYRHGCAVFPFPSARTILNHFQGENAAIRSALSESASLGPLKTFL
jgi:hypothetical protein